MKSNKQWQWVLGAVVGMVVIITVAFATLSGTNNLKQTPLKPVAQTEQSAEQPQPVQNPVAQSSENTIVQDGGFDQSEANNWINFRLKVQREDNGNYFASNRFNWSLYQQIKLDSDSWYALSARLRKGMSKSSARICLQFKNSEGIVIGEPFDYYHTFIGSDWEKAESVNFRTPVGTTGATLFLMSGDGGTNDFDDISIEQLAAPVPSDIAKSNQTQNLTETQNEVITTASGVTYTVITGDTLSNIAYEFNVSLEDLIKANGITDAAKIKPGQQLIIPIGTN